MTFGRDDTAAPEAAPTDRAKGRDYLYMITEEKGSEEYITYDEKQYYVVVHVYAVDDGGVQVKAELLAWSVGADGVVQTPGAGEEASEFVNKYSAHAEPDVKIGVSKTLEGREFLASDTFTFEIESIDGGPLPTENADSYVYDEERKVGVYTLTGEPWTFDFPAIPFNETHAGKTYRYAITEVTGSIPGMNYSTDRWTVNVTVNDKHDGTCHQV